MALTEDAQAFYVASDFVLAPADIASRREKPMKKTSCTVAALVLSVSICAKERLDVKIVDRQTSDTNYSYVVPGQLFSQSNANAHCFGSVDAVSCSGSTTTTGVVVPPRPVEYDVRGATFTLRLADGRLVVVNCESKYAPRGDYINRRSCRMPLVDDIQVEFDGDKAKLFWIVSIDGKKSESETYKILAILNKP
jgi:hypothetical protein